MANSIPSVADTDPAIAAVRALVQAASAPMAVFDADGECLAANPAFVQRAARAGDAANDDGAERRSAFSPDGTRTWTLASFAATAGHLDARLREAKDQADEAARARARFLGQMGHDLRTPLNAVIGFAEIMREQAAGPLSPDYLEYAGLIHESGRTLLDLINSLVDLARAELDTLALKVADVEVLRLLRSVAAVARDGAASGGAAPLLEVEPKSGAFGIRADEQRLRQVLRALIEVALKSAGPTAPVTLRVQPLAEDGVEVVVAGTGRGIPPAGSGGGAGRAREAGGVGLRLAHQLAILHGGTLTMDSQPGQGTRAVLRLPHAPPEAGPAQTA